MSLNHLQAKIACTKNIYDKLEIKFKSNKYVIGLKYEFMNFRINVIQLSVIFFSACVTFIETLKEHFHLSNSSSTLIPIVLSTYVTLIISLSRFYRLDEQKEGLSKLFEKHAFVINRIKHKLRTIELECNICHDTDLSKVDTTLMSFDNDGLNDVITQCLNDADVMITLKEKLYYENLLIKLHIDRKVLKRNLRNIESYDGDMNGYKKKVSLVWYYMCFECLGNNYIIKDDDAFTDIEKENDKNNVRNI